MIDRKRYSLVAASEKECKHKYVQLLAGIEQEKRSVLTVGKAMDKYILAKTDILSASTIRGYKQIRKHRLSTLMGVNISDLTNEMVQLAVKSDKEKGYSAKSIKNAHGLLSAVLKEYRSNFHLTTTFPREKSKPVVIPSEQDISAILAAAKGSNYEMPIIIAAWLGLRMSEIRGLRFSDFNGDKLHIQRAVVTGENGVSVLNEYTKTDSGDRIISIPKELEMKIKNIPHKSDDEFITTLSEGAIYKGFIRQCEKAGINPFRFHDLRHFAASEAHALGVPDKYLQQRMGHKTDHMLRHVYLHTIRDQEDAFADIIDSKMNQIINLE